MSYKEDRKMIDEMINKFKQKKQEKDELTRASVQFSRKISQTEIQVIKLTNREYYEQVKKFNESEVYKSALKFVEEVRANGVRYDYYQRTLSDEIARMTAEAKRMTAGFEGEQKVYEELKKLLPDDWSIFQNIILNGSEHDILVLSKKGLYTIEVKNHATIMSWDRLGRYTEYKMGRRLRPDVIPGAVDPYSQVLSHVKSLTNFLSSLKPVSIPPSILHADGIVTIANNAEVRTELHSLLPVYGISHTAHVIESQDAKKAPLPEKVMAYLRYSIVKHAQPAKIYDFHDLTGIEKILEDNFPKFMELQNKINEVDIEIEDMVDQFKRYRFSFEFRYREGHYFSNFYKDETTFKAHPILCSIMLTALALCIFSNIKYKLIFFFIASIPAFIICIICLCKLFYARSEAKKYGELYSLIDNLRFE